MKSVDSASSFVRMRFVLKKLETIIDSIYKRVQSWTPKEKNKLIIQTLVTMYLWAVREEMRLCKYYYRLIGKQVLSRVVGIVCSVQNKHALNKQSVTDS